MTRAASEPTGPHAAPDPRERLVALLAPVLARVAELRPQDVRDADAASRLADALETEIPFRGEIAQTIGAEIRRGIADGWLCDRGEPDARFSRVAKASDATRGLSIDVVALRGAALRHGHPQGEVTLGFDAEGSMASDARFDGWPPGWVVMPAGSTHTPTVEGPRMHLLYFLPAGAVDWNPET
jgi:hypothetical protein